MSESHRIRKKWEYAQWITEHFADTVGPGLEVWTEEFNADPEGAFGPFSGDSDYAARGQLLSELLEDPVAGGGFTSEAEVLNAIGARGWELVKVERVKDKEDGATVVTRTFKRPESSATEVPTPAPVHAEPEIVEKPGEPKAVPEYPWRKILKTRRSGEGDVTREG